MSPFTDYLLSTGRLSEEQLLRACIEQLEATPPLAAVVLHNGMLKPEEQLSVLKKQATEGLGYQQACVALGLWTDKLAAAVDHAITEGRPSLAQILVNKGLLSVADIHLKQSLAEMQGQLAATSQEAVRAEFDQLNPILVDEYALLFKTDDYQTILAASSALPLTPSPERKKALDAILEHIQGVQRGVSFLGFKSVEGLLQAIIHLLEAMVAAVTHFRSDETQALQAGLALFWQLSPSQLHAPNLPMKRAS